MVYSLFEFIEFIVAIKIVAQTYKKFIELRLDAFILLKESF